MYIALALFGLGIALFLTLILTMLYKINLKPVWILFVIVPIIVGTAGYYNERYGAIAIGIFFGFMVVLFVVKIIIDLLQGLYQGIQSKKFKNLPLFKKIIQLLILATIPLAFIFPPYFILAFITFIIVGKILPNPTSRFFDLQTNLPTSKIRSMAMGLVEVEGRLRMIEPVISPIGEVPCIGYEYIVEDISRDDEGKKSYSTISSEIVCKRFFIRDDSGEVEVNPEGIDFIKIPCGAQNETGQRRYSEYILNDGDEVLMVAAASVEGQKTVLAKEKVKNIFGIVNLAKLNFWIKFQPLRQAFILFTAIIFLGIALILILPMRVLVPESYQPKRDIALPVWIPIEEDGSKDEGEGDRPNTSMISNKESVVEKKDIKKITSITERNSLTDFLPKDYVIFEKIFGDINNDGLEDCIIITKGTDKNKIVNDEYRGKLDRNRRGIIVLLSKGDIYELAVKNYDCFSSENEDGGVYFPPELSVEINKGNLYIQYAHGRYGYWSYTFRLQNSDFELIGYDASENRGPVIISETSINYLTKKKIVKENVNENSESGDEVFKETVTKMSATKLIKLSEIKNFDELEIL